MVKMDGNFTVWVMCDICQRAFTSATSLVAHKINSHIYPKTRITWKTNYFKGNFLPTRTRRVAVVTVVPEARRRWSCMSKLTERKSSWTVRNPMKAVKTLSESFVEPPSEHSVDKTFSQNTNVTVHVSEHNYAQVDPAGESQYEFPGTITKDSANEYETTKDFEAVMYDHHSTKNDTTTQCDTIVKATNLITEESKSIPESVTDGQPLRIDDFKSIIETVIACHLPEGDSCLSKDSRSGDPQAKDRTEKFSTLLSSDSSILQEIICENKKIVTKRLPYKKRKEHSNVHADLSPALKCEAPDYKDFVYVRNEEVDSIHGVELEALAIRNNRLSSNVVVCPICSVKLSSNSLLVHLKKCLKCPSCKAKLTDSSIYNSVSAHFKNSPQCYSVKCQTCTLLYYSYAYRPNAFPLFTSSTGLVM